MQQQQPSSPSSKYPNTKLLTGYDLSDNDFQYMNSQYSDGIISPTSANSIKNLYPSTTSTSSSSSTSPIPSDRIKNQDKSKKNLMADYDDDEDDDDDDDEDEEDQEQEDRRGERETFGRPSELIGMRPSKLYLSVTGPPPNVHVDVNEMVTLEKPEWKLKQRCCVTTCK